MLSAELSVVSVLFSLFFFSLINMTPILQSCRQDWLLRCTHIAHFTEHTCPRVADLHFEDTQKFNQFLFWGAGGHIGGGGAFAQWIMN